MLLLLKVRYFQNDFLVSSISSKKRQKPVDLRFHSSKVEFVRLLFGGNVGLKKLFRLCLTFSSHPSYSLPWTKRFRESWLLYSVVHTYVCIMYILCILHWIQRTEPLRCHCGAMNDRILHVLVCADSNAASKGDVQKERFSFILITKSFVGKTDARRFKT